MQSFGLVDKNTETHKQNKNGNSFKWIKKKEGSEFSAENRLLFELSHQTADEKKALKWINIKIDETALGMLRNITIMMINSNWNRM